MSARTRVLLPTTISSIECAKRKRDVVLGCCVYDTYLRGVNLARLVLYTRFKVYTCQSYSNHVAATRLLYREDLMYGNCTYIYIMMRLDN